MDDVGDGICGGVLVVAGGGDDAGGAGVEHGGDSGYVVAVTVAALNMVWQMCWGHHPWSWFLCLQRRW